ncbi:hypothetical protein Q669_29620 [Labrenzia sp. C1B10]|uniref:methyltransferase n=1 Tax=unclassified Labrenzia TaxID=2648686 RepID=UPI0003B875AA|nr:MULTISPECIES: methyltransferase [unclassified Labrenzia]ERP95730.1 hypothetical protein Q669_29620 [Labrenzia sp. C1B10]ERS05796.1 hypothetical protein Q675_29185 [Labrenzia sp. C1B70]
MNIEVGKQVVDMYGNKGFVAEVKAARSNVMTIGAGGLQKPGCDLVICFYDGSVRISEVPDTIAAPWFATAEGQELEPITCESERAQLVDAAKRHVADSHDRARREQEERRNRDNEFKDRIRDMAPDWAKAAIVAEMQIDDCDSMSDYYNTKTGKRILLAWSRHERNLFPEMRKAALNHAETKFLFDAPKTAEHAENYSMGAGYYLKDGGRYRTGWTVKKIKFYGKGVDYLPFCDEIALPTETEAPKATVSPIHVETDGLFSIEEHTHTKKGFQMFVCVMSRRISTEDFKQLTFEARNLKGWYSRQWGATPAGFAFKSLEAAQEFVKTHGGNPAETEAATDTDSPSPAPVANRQSVADRFREMADGMQSAIDSKFADKLENTPRRQRMAESARQDGRRLERTQKALRALADLHESGDCPAILASLKTKAAIHDLTGSKINHSGNYYDAGRETGEPAKDTEQARALWGILNMSKPDPKAEQLRELQNRVQFANIPGYFPTPRALVERMIEEAGLASDFAGTILEPEAGSGGIADVIRDHAPDAKLICVERHLTLAQILKLKGHSVVTGDFLETDAEPAFDFVFMNPPFEKGQDMRHIMHAYTRLNEGGTLVAIASNGVSFRQDNATGFFRAWLDSVGGTIEALPDNSFKESGTGVATVLIAIRAPIASTIN